MMMSTDPQITIASAHSYCNKKWATNEFGVTLIHYCYLDAGHDGPCGCGYCHEYPLELHPIEGEDHE